MITLAARRLPSIKANTLVVSGRRLRLDNLEFILGIHYPDDDFEVVVLPNGNIGAKLPTYLVRFKSNINEKRAKEFFRKHNLFGVAIL